MTTTPSPTPATCSAPDLPIIVKDRRRRGFFIIDNALLDRFGTQLKAHGLAVYMTLARFANAEGTCWPSLSTIARKTGMSRPQVIREIAKLTALRLIAVEHQVNDKGEYSSNLYILLDLTPLSPEQERVTPRDQGGISQRLPLVSAGDQGGISQRPKQHSANKTQHRNKTQRTTRAHTDHNNNSGGYPAPTADVVVASPPSVIQKTFDAFPQNNPEKAAVLDTSVQEAPTPLDPPAPGQTDASALIAVGIAPTVAQRLASRYSQQRIAEKLAYLDFLQDEQPDKVQNPCGWLRRAIEEDYARPDGYKSAAERVAEAAETRRQEEEWRRMITARDQQEKAEREREQQETADQLTQVYSTYGTTQHEIDLWRQMLAEFKLSMPAASFSAYVAGTVLLSLQGGEALIGLPNQRAHDWLENRFAPNIQRTLASRLDGQKLTVKFVALDG